MPSRHPRRPRRGRPSAAASGSRTSRPGASSELDPFDPLERLDAALDLRGFGGMRREALDEALLLGQHRLLTGIGGLTVGLADCPLLLVEVVVARIDGNL